MVSLLTIVIIDNYWSIVYGLDTGDASAYCHKKPFTWLRYTIVGDGNWNTIKHSSSVSFKIEIH